MGVAQHEAMAAGESKSAEARAALGNDVPEMAYCPLVPKNVSARVTATDTGFAVAVRSEDASTATEILRRSRALAAR